MLGRQAQEILQYAEQTWGHRPDAPWLKYPENLVLRHPGSRKWYALLMPVARCKLGLSGEGSVDVINLKCGAELSGSLRQMAGCFPAYHMNKKLWLTVLLDGTLPTEEILQLVELSFSLTADKK